MKLNIEKNEAGILIYDIINGHLFQRYYQGYTLREAKRLFKADAEAHK